MSDPNSIIDEIRQLAEQFQRVQKEAADYYTMRVDQVINGEITDAQAIETIMDGLTDFGDNLDCLDQYKRLCRHIFYKYPKLVGEHISLFRLLWDSSDDDVKGKETDA